MNLSKFSTDATARTRPTCALQRLQNLVCLGSEKVLELCVGHSLEVFDEAAKKLGIEVTGNDFDSQWKSFYPTGRWIMGDAIGISWEGFDSVVFAPPLSRGCSGTRADSLMINQVSPGYDKFLSRALVETPRVAVLVLPARSLATRQDRDEYYKLLAATRQVWLNVEPIPLVADVIRKYVDVYCW